MTPRGRRSRDNRNSCLRSRREASNSPRSSSPAGLQFDDPRARPDAPPAYAEHALLCRWRSGRRILVFARPIELLEIRGRTAENLHDRPAGGTALRFWATALVDLKEFFERCSTARSRLSLFGPSGKHVAISEPNLKRASRCIVAAFSSGAGAAKNAATSNGRVGDKPIRRFRQCARKGGYRRLQGLLKRSGLSIRLFGIIGSRYPSC